MTRKDIAHRLTATTGLTASQSTIAVEAILRIMREALQNDEEITLRQFGIFRTSMSKRTKGRDITRNCFVAIPPHKVVKFYPSNMILVRDE